MLVHICCSVDSHYFLQKLQNEYPEEKLTGFFMTQTFTLTPNTTYDY